MTSDKYTIDYSMVSHGWARDTNEKRPQVLSVGTPSTSLGVVLRQKNAQDGERKSNHELVEPQLYRWLREMEMLKETGAA